MIIHLPDGHTASYMRVPGLEGFGSSSALPFDIAFHNAEYNGGPVMPSNTNYTFYWDPSGAQEYATGYEAGVNRYLEDLAADSGGVQNTDSVAAQYDDAAGQFASYDSHFGGALIDTHPYPANGCSRGSVCLTEAQIAQELARYLKEHDLPAGLEHEYFVLTPPGVESCFEAAGGACSYDAYCAYHGNAAYEGGQLIFTDLPYAPGTRCEDTVHPNGTSSDSVLSALSHEHIESITDPEPNTAWTEFAPEVGELADKCEESFGPALGSTADGEYNEVINGDDYYTQEIWSNQGHQCLQRLAFSGTHPTAAFKSHLLAGGAVEVNAAGSSAPGGIADYAWQLNTGGSSHDDPGKPYETGSAKDRFVLPGPGTYDVALTVFAHDGTSAGTGHAVAVTASGPGVLAEPASAITRSTATLNAVIDPGGSAVTECTFEYGPTSAYGASAPCSPAPGSSPGPVQVSADIAGLETNTDYHFRVVARSAGGTSASADTGFATLPDPPTIEGEGASAVGLTGATLQGVVKPEGDRVTHCFFEYATTTPLPEAATRAKCPKAGLSGDASVPETALLRKLPSGTDYHFRLSVEYIADGQVLQAGSPEESFQTTGANVTLEAPEPESTGAVVKASVDPEGTTVSECWIEYGLTKRYGHTVACEPSAPFSGGGPIAITAKIGELAEGAVYLYRVNATDSAGVARADGTFQTPVVAAPTVTDHAGEVSRGAAELVASVDPNGGEVTSCLFEYGTADEILGGFLGGSAAPCAAAIGSGSRAVEIKHELEGLASGTTYYFRVTATNRAGTSSGPVGELRTGALGLETKLAALRRGAPVLLRSNTVSLGGSASLRCGQSSITGEVGGEQQLRLSSSSFTGGAEEGQCEADLFQNAPEHFAMYPARVSLDLPWQLPLTQQLGSVTSQLTLPKLRVTEKIVFAPFRIEEEETCVYSPAETEYVTDGYGTGTLALPLESVRMVLDSLESSSECAASESLTASFALTSGGDAVNAANVIDETAPFDAVSCAATSLCVAADEAGRVFVSGDPTAATPTWSRGADIDEGNPIAGISCASPSLCVGVDIFGNVLVSDDPGAESPTWSRSHVDSVKREVAPGVDLEALLSVSCPSSSLCVAGDVAGDVVTSTDPGAGTPTWTAPRRIDGERQLSSVSCPSTSLCVAVDEAGNALASEDPGDASPTWSSSAIDPGEALVDVSCPSSSLCVAVDEGGNVLTSQDPGAASPAWSSSAIDPAGELTGVSCASTSLCVAVDAAGGELVSEDPAAPSPAWGPAQHADNDPIRGLACPSASLCVAVDESGKALSSDEPGATPPVWTEGVPAGG